MTLLLWGIFPIGLLQGSGYVYAIMAVNIVMMMMMMMMMIFFKWYDGYKKRKAQKASIKEDLMPIAWHPLRWWDWCVPEDEKGSVENLWA